MKAYEAHMNVHVCVDVCYRVPVPLQGIALVRRGNGDRKCIGERARNDIAGPRLWVAYCDICSVACCGW